jgi:hypothetical protein
LPASVCVQTLDSSSQLLMLMLALELVCNLTSFSIGFS